ncbi:MAG: septum formation initiator FtsB [Candidatus Desulfovibrio kirbyi]|jgi:cell division protein FtsB|uniref:Septum formation initiator FtsB n=1 Tax=Candidatus Desulfovibrio kirbyi TaxID=2696086 RepID=A0A6L2R5Q9_9BACT|nr:septum formation initiator family protein [Desulfovibrio sp.]GFH62879.1 MAG: septum formation initiator FtsB [Candidatus Desulfovibrio kirbyi]
MFWRVFLLVALGIVAVVLFSRMVWGPTGLLEYRALKQQHTEIKQKISDLDARNLALSREIRLMQSDNQYMEKMIRQRLHYVRDNEVLYLFENSSGINSGATNDDRKN